MSVDVCTCACACVRVHVIFCLDSVVSSLQYRFKQFTFEPASQPAVIIG